MSAETEASSSQKSSSSSSLELFFDLVFVYAFAQVTGFLADNLTWLGLLQGAALLAVLWWAWVTYSWLTNAVPVDDVTPARLIILAAMAAMLVVTLAIPDAFGEHAVLFGVAYFVVRLLQVALLALATEGEMRRAILRLAPCFLGGPALLVLAGFQDGWAQPALWIAALVIDYGAPLVLGVDGFHVRAAHFTDRHGAVILIALGEAITEIGEPGLEVDAGIIVAALLAIVLSAALAWAYFDYIALAARQRLEATRGRERARLARDAFSYLHLVMVAGIILVALGLRETIAHVTDPLETIPALALCGGAALYLLGQNAFQLRDEGTVSTRRMIVAALSCALIPIALSTQAVITLAILATFFVALVAVETLRPDKLRRKVRDDADGLQRKQADGSRVKIS